MEKKWSLILVVALSAVFVSASLYAGAGVPEVIKMETKAYKKHTKGIVEFSHKKHMDDYAKQAPDLYKDGCGACHHDDEHNPLTNLKADDEVQACIECHEKTGKKEKGDEKLDYHKNAMHENCQGCHKAFNKAKDLKPKDPKAAPTGCNKCHPKKQK